MTLDPEFDSRLPHSPVPPALFIQEDFQVHPLGASWISLSSGLQERDNEPIALGSLNAVPGDSGSRGDLWRACASPPTSFKTQVHVPASLLPEVQE